MVLRGAQSECVLRVLYDSAIEIALSIIYYPGTFSIYLTEEICIKAGDI